MDNNYNFFLPRGPELFGHSDLGIDSNTIEPLLNNEMVASLIRK